MLPVLGRRRRIPQSIKLTLSIASILATAYVTASARHAVPSYEPAVITAIIIIAVVAIGTSVRAAYWGRQEAKKTSIKEALTGVLFEIQDKTGTDARGVNAVFLVIRTSWRLRRYLDPTVRGELGAHEPSRVQWYKNKGAVGVCWHQEQAHFADLRPLHDELGTCSEAAWESAPIVVDRMNLTFRDWQRTRSKYGFVIAAPVPDKHENKRITGVVAVNGPLTADWTGIGAKLRNVVIVTAQTVQNLL